MPISWQSFVIHLINIVVLFVFLRGIIYKPVSDFMHRRREHFAAEMQDLQKQQELLAQREQLAEKTIDDARKQALQILEDAEKAAQQRAELIIKEAEQKANMLLAEARAAIAAERKRAREAMHTEAVNLAVEFAARILAEEMTPAHNKEFIDRLTERRQLHG
ncbi:MAG: F0F1 ATP synthase subunit B [Firmicutes bacterium]|nr:F0F1 ATP synthase subunit B [Bacillota bacterium]